MSRIGIRRASGLRDGRQHGPTGVVAAALLGVTLALTWAASRPVISAQATVTPGLLPAPSSTANPPNDAALEADAALLALSLAVEEADLAASASTLWRGGTLGLQENLDLALAVGEKMPAFGLPARDGEPYQLDLVGRPVLINFWASWCAPCQEEFPILIAADYSDLPFDVVFVNVWDEPPGSAAFLAGYPAGLEVVIDATGLLPALYHLEFVPVTILIDAYGTVQLIQRGTVSQAVIDFAAALLLEQPTQAADPDN